MHDLPEVKLEVFLMKMYIQYMHVSCIMSLMNTRVHLKRHQKPQHTPQQHVI